MIEIEFTKKENDTPGYSTYDAYINFKHYSIRFVTHAMPENEDRLKEVIKSGLLSSIEVIL